MRKKSLQKLAIEVRKILLDELSKANVDYAYVEARIYDIKCVGVQGDDRSYGHPAEITLLKNDNPLWAGYEEFISRLSTRITNEVKGVNKVVYVFRR